MLYLPVLIKSYDPWNKSKLIGQKLPLKLPEICAIRIQLQLKHKIKELALFNLAIDRKLRSCDLVTLKVRDVTNENSILPRTMIPQQKTKKPVQFEITEQTRDSISKWIALRVLVSSDYLFSTRQYHRLVHKWVGLGPTSHFIELI